MPKHLDICISIVIMYVFELPIDLVCTMRSLTGGGSSAPWDFQLVAYLSF